MIRDGFSRMNPKRALAGMACALCLSACFQRAAPDAPAAASAPPPAAQAPLAPPAEAPAAVATPAPPEPPPAPSPPAPKPAAPAKPAATTPAAKAPSSAPKPKPAPPAPVPQAAPTPKPAPALDLNALEQRLKDTKAIGVFTKLSLKNQVDDLLDEVRSYHRNGNKSVQPELRQQFDGLMLKVLSLLQNGDPQLAGAIAASRDALWGILMDPDKFSKI